MILTATVISQNYDSVITIIYRQLVDQVRNIIWIMRLYSTDNTASISTVSLTSHGNISRAEINVVKLRVWLIG